MRDQNRICRPFIRVVIAVVLAGQLLAGCQESSPNASNAGSSIPPQNSREIVGSNRSIDDRDASTLLSQLADRYRELTSYRDEAVLYLNYRLEGQRIQEPHPFSTIWDRSGRVAGKLFNGNYSYDGEWLSCYVFDIETANLDNQQLMLPVGPRQAMVKLFGDPIVRHFLGGYSELPLDESEKAKPPKLLPPPLCLVSGQLPFGWIESPTQAERLPDATVDETQCVVVRSLFRDTTADLWIDPVTMTLIQVSMPLKLMDRKVLTSGEIADVQLLYRFHNVQFNAKIQPDEFQTTARQDVTTVRQFVKIPDPLPTDLVGETAPAFNLFTPQRRRITEKEFAGKPTALLWVGGEHTYETAGKFADLRDSQSEDVQIAVIYSGIDLADSNDGRLDPKPSLLTRIGKTSVYFDQNLDASARLRIRALPTIIVLDRNAVIQFALAVDDENWVDDVRAAIDRVERGENVAAEMKSAYQQFLDEYHEQLVSVQTPRGNRSTSDNSINNQRSSDFVAGGFSNSAVKLIPAWTNSDLKQPGNILFDSARNSLWIFDGWQSVVEVGIDGQTIRRKPLNLPPAQTVSRMRQVTPPGRPPEYIAFSVGSENAFLFDEQWNSTRTISTDLFPASPSTGFQDVRAWSVDQNDGAVLFLAMANGNGIGTLRVNSGKTDFQSISVNSLDVLEQQIYGCDGVSVFRINDGAIAESHGSSDGFAYRSVHVNQAASHVLAVGVNDRQQWRLSVMDRNLQLMWQRPIGPQEFTTQIESVTMGATLPDSSTPPVEAPLSTASLSSWIGVAGSDRSVSLFSADGSRGANLPVTHEITGITLFESNQRLHLVLSDSNTLTCYEVGFAGRFLPASSQNKPRN